MGDVRRWRLTAGLIAAGVAVAVGLAGCGAGSSDDAGSTSDSGVVGLTDEGAAPGVGAPAPAQENAGAGQDSAAGEAPAREPAKAQPDQPTRIAADQRSIIYTGSITVRVDEPAQVDENAAEAIAIVTTAGGFVGSDQRTRDDGRSQASLQLRVPAAKFTGVVDELAELGDEEARKIDTEDVTEQVVDLDARIASQQASVNRTRTLLAQARTIAEIVAVEGELAKREAELGSLQAKQRRLADLTALSTITLTLLGPEAERPEDESETGFIAGVKAGWKAFLASMQVLLTILGVLLPWLVALVLPIAVVIWGYRRTRPVPPPPPPA